MLVFSYTSCLDSRKVAALTPNLQTADADAEISLMLWLVISRLLGRV